MTGMVLAPHKARRARPTTMHTLRSAREGCPSDCSTMVMVMILGDPGVWQTARRNVSGRASERFMPAAVHPAHAALQPYCTDHHPRVRHELVGSIMAHASSPSVRLSLFLLAALCISVLLRSAA